MHSDMGWQYQHDGYCKTLEEAGIVQSVSRKGNCIDNGATEQVFGHIKDEFFRGQSFESFEEFKERLEAVSYTHLTRGSLQDEIKRIHRQTGITVLFVTHDIDEALDLGDKVLVMEAGRAVQFAEPCDILRNPATEFVDRLVTRKRTVDVYKRQALHHGIQAFSQLRIVHADDHADVHSQHRRDDEADEQVRAQLFGEQRPIHESLLSPPGSSCRTGA